MSTSAVAPGHRRGWWQRLGYWLLPPHPAPPSGSEQWEAEWGGSASAAEPLPKRRVVARLTLDFLRRQRRASGPGPDPAAMRNHQTRYAAEQRQGALLDAARPPGRRYASALPADPGEAGAPAGRATLGPPQSPPLAP